MTPAERLRAAAEKIRETAQAAPPAPWRAVTFSTVPPHVKREWHDEQGRRCQKLVTDRVDGGEAAEHIALWSPPVALLVAKVLDQHAEEHGIYDCQWVDCDALALADLILGAES